ncbi:MAG: acyl carrier protein [Microvirga sp.]|nr:acyl carrier protein [Microvirga sp.]
MAQSTLSETDIRKDLNAYLIANATTPVAGDIDPQENLLDSGILDSLGIAEITEHMETAFGIVIEEDEVSARNYRSLDTLTAFCLSKVGSAASAA